MEIVQGVHQIKLPLPGGTLDHVNVYLVEGDEGNLLIDAGWNTPEAFSALKEELMTKGFEFKDISQIVITHLHPDHYGLAGKIRELSGAKIALSEIETHMLNSRYVDMTPLLSGVTRLLRSNGVPESELPQLSEASLPAREFVIPASPDVKLKAGRKVSVGLFEFEVLSTPGHSPGHICLYEPKRKLLFTGDHILPDITPNVGLHPQSGGNPLGDYLNSLRDLKKLEVTFAFPGHGSVFNGLRLRIEDLFYHHEQRKSAIVRVIQGEMKTAYEIAEEIPWVPGAEDVSFQDLLAFDKRLAVLETLAHLQLLISEDKVKKAAQDGTNFYSARD